VTGAPSLIQSTFGTGAGHGNFEAAVPQGGRLVHWFKDNASTANHWIRAQDIVTDGDVNSTGSLIQSTLGTEAGHLGNFEVVVLRERADLPPFSHLEKADTDFHINDTPARAWARGQTVTYRGRSEKICQLTGSFDKETLQKTANDTERFNLAATDLGYPVDDGTTLSIYFGDSRVAHGTPLTKDEWAWDAALGISVDRAPPTPESCLRMEMVTNPADNSSFAPLVVKQLAPTPPERRFFQGLFNVPASGFTVGTTSYALFWTDHCAFLSPDGTSCVNPAPETDIRGTGRLTRKTGPAEFQELYQLPPGFNYTASLNVDNIPGVPAGQNLGVYIWGIDLYRASYPRLAYVRAANVGSLQEWRFLAGVDADGTPNWNTSSAGQPIFTDGDPAPGCIGEFSVSWVAPLKEWLMLYNCGGAVRARLARAPWGPWSDPIDIFRPDIDNARCRYMHAENYPWCTDHLDGDNSVQTGGRDNGDPYAPYVLSRFTRATPQGAKIIFLMSTWNPYQVVVMQTNLTSSR
jgi:Domain of unknown function (DUF4185)